MVGVTTPHKQPKPPFDVDDFIDTFLQVMVVALMVALVGIVLAIPFVFAIQRGDWGGVVALGCFIAFIGVVALVSLVVQRWRA